MNKPLTPEKPSKTDLARLAAMSDAQIVYDDDTGAPLTAQEVEGIVGEGVAAEGLADFRAKMKRAEST